MFVLWFRFRSWLSGFRWPLSLGSISYLWSGRLLLLLRWWLLSNHPPLQPWLLYLKTYIPFPWAGSVPHWPAFLFPIKATRERQPHPKGCTRISFACFFAAFVRNTKNSRKKIRYKSFLARVRAFRVLRYGILITRARGAFPAVFLCRIMYVMLSIIW